MTDQWRAPIPPGDGREARQRPEETAERLLTWWQRALRWISWLTFLGLAVWNSQSVYFGPLEWLALIAAIAISIWCMAKPLGGPKFELSEPAHLLGAFVSRTNWALVIIGALLTVGGVAGAAAAIYDVSTGRATVGDVMKDIAIFVEGWFVEVFVPTYDAELEKTHVYALFLLIVPGLLLLWFNLIPFFKRGIEFRVEQDGSVMVRSGDSWEPLMEYQYATVTADGNTIDFTPARRSAGGPASTGPRVLPRIRRTAEEQGQCRVLPAATRRPRLRHRGAADGKQFHRTSTMTGSASGPRSVVTPRIRSGSPGRCAR